MYSLTIHFGPNAMVWAFLFKEKEKAEAAELQARAFLHESPGFRIEDDYGQSASFRREDVHGVLLEDLEATEEARILRSLANARGQAKTFERAKNDPLIRNINTQRPGVLTPFANGQFQ